MSVLLSTLRTLSSNLFGLTRLADFGYQVADKVGPMNSRRHVNVLGWLQMNPREDLPVSEESVVGS